MPQKRANPADKILAEICKLREDSDKSLLRYLEAQARIRKLEIEILKQPKPKKGR